MRAISVIILLNCWIISTVAGRLFLSFPTLSHYCPPSKGDLCIQIYKCPFFANLLNNTPIPRPRNVIYLIQDYQCGFDGNIPQVCCFRETILAALPNHPVDTSSEMPALETTSVSTTTMSTTEVSSSEKSPEVTTSSTAMRSATFGHSDYSTEGYISKKHATENSSTLPQLHSIADRSNVDLRKHKNYDLLPNDICGPIFEGYRITSGNSAGLGEFPWMALIVYYTGAGLDFRCGATLINERYVLTAAHCILNSTIVGVRLGEHDISTNEDCEGSRCLHPVQDFYIKDIIVHPDYKDGSSQNDIALIRIDAAANFTHENVQPICLPFRDYQLEGKYATVSGWGVTQDGFRSPALKKASIPIVPLEECQSGYRTLVNITGDQICAGGESGKDTCDGDSGGPLARVTSVNGTMRFVQYGIVSYGSRYCGSPNQPAVYTRVSSYLEWILDNLKPTN